MWRARAQCVAEETLRADALSALAVKRPHLDGAAMFVTLAARRPARHLLRALVCYEATLEYLDNANERAAEAGVRNGRRLHTALRDAITPPCPFANYYRYHGSRDDTGLLTALVGACREAIATLASYPVVAPFLANETERTEVLALNHDPCPARRDEELRTWAAENAEIMPAARWFERTGAATGSVNVHALIALAADPAATAHDARRTLAVYRPLSLLATMLDSYADHASDRKDGGHSYRDHYGSRHLGAEETSRWLRETTGATLELRQGHRHAVIAACMIALYLSSEAARAPQQKQPTVTLLTAAGGLTRMLLPVLRAWRVAYGLTEA
jgi:tetraprenyl-beta-curcumene synthase